MTVDGQSLESVQESDPTSSGDTPSEDVGVSDQEQFKLLDELRSLAVRDRNSRWFIIVPILLALYGLPSLMGLEELYIAAVVVTAALVATTLGSAVFRRRRLGRIRQIAILLRDMGSVDGVGPLLDAMYTGDPATARGVRDALVRLLPLAANATDHLRPEYREKLHQILRSGDKPLVLASVQVLEKFGTRESARLIAELGGIIKRPSTVSRSLDLEICTAASQTYNQICARLAREATHASLLRPSDQDSTVARNLLRPAGQDSTDSSSVLVRPANASTEEAGHRPVQKPSDQAAGAAIRSQT